MTTRTPDLLALLRDHADQHGDQLAHVLPDRDITYRRLWSRIERGSARLYGEWGIREGDLVAYLGRGHPDAIVLYFALLRLGAILLPLESMSTVQASQILAERQPKLLLQDQSASMAGSTTYRLEALLATWSHHDPVLVDAPMSHATLWLRETPQDWYPTSLDQLCATLPATPRTTFIDQHIFSAELLRHTVLPSLRDHQLMQFAATDRVPGTGS